MSPRSPKIVAAVGVVAAFVLIWNVLAQEVAPGETGRHSLLIGFAALTLIIGLFALMLRTQRCLEQASREIEEREQRYRSLFQSSLGGIALVGPQGELQEWNDRLPALLGAVDAAVADSPAAQSPWQESARELARIAARHPPGEQREINVLRSDGQRRWITIRQWPMTGGSEGAFWLLVHDATRRQDTRTRLRLAQQAFQSMSEAILVTDVTTRIIDINPAFERMTGFSREEAIGAKSSILRSGQHDEAFFRDLWARILAEGHWVGEIWNRCRDGRVIPCWMHIDAVADPLSGQVTHYIGVLSDISERKRIEERVSFLAHHDPLTGLSNRFSFDAIFPQSLAVARRNGRRVALLFVDLDRFKEINDTLGHGAGDQVLVEVARRLQTTIRDSDFLARIGGDEFVILLNDADGHDDALRVAHAVLDALRPPIDSTGHPLLVTPSIGISLFPEDGDEPDILLSRADSAMYRVKSSGRDGYQFHSAQRH